MTRSHRLPFVGVVLMLLPLLPLLAARQFDERLGLVGSYFSRIDWSGASFSRIDRQVTTDHIRTVRFAADRPFAVTWKGLLAVEHQGSYRFEIVSDDGSAVRIGGRTIIDISGRHGPLAGRGTVDLERGMHPIEIDFYEAGGGWMIDLFWAPPGQELRRVPASALLHEQMPMAQYSLLRRVADAAPFAPIAWILGGGFLLAAWLSGHPIVRTVQQELRWPPLACVMCASVLVNVMGVWWGYPAGWAPDEIGAVDVLTGMSQFFSNGWHTRYPPLQYYLLALLAAPFMLADLLRPADVLDETAAAVLFIVNRLATVTMAAGTILACYFCARELKDRVAGVLAAAALAVVLPFVYYAKVANLDVPYLFWFALSMLAYVRILRDNSPWAYRMFALTAVLAVCTKDQAYGFYVLPAVHVVMHRLRRLGRLVPDRVLLSSAAIAIAAGVVLSNLVFNFSGFVEHVRLITGGASVGYEMVPPTIQGRLELFADTVRLIRWSFGWPLFVLAIGAVVASAIERDRSLWLMLPALSYVLFFLNVVLYVYDRFLLGICLVLAIVLGCRLSEWAASARTARAPLAVAAVLVAAIGFTQAAANAVSLNVMMIGDSRYAVQRWFRSNVRRDASVALIGRAEYLPVLDGFVVERMEPPHVHAAPHHEYVVVNAKYIRRFGPGSDAYELYEHLIGGSQYALVLREGPSRPWLPLARDPIFERPEEDPYSNLTKVDPSIEVYRRRADLRD